MRISRELTKSLFTDSLSISSPVGKTGLQEYITQEPERIGKTGVKRNTVRSDRWSVERAEQGV